MNEDLQLLKENKTSASPDCYQANKQQEAGGCMTSRVTLIYQKNTKQEFSCRSLHVHEKNLVKEFNDLITTASSDYRNVFN